MEDPKKELGQLFKDKRQEMNLSLKEVENAISIKVNYLKAIEDGTVNKMLSKVYIMGFIRQYAAFLNLDAEKIIQQNSNNFTSKKEETQGNLDFGSLEVRNPKSKSVFSGKYIVIIVFVLIAAWFFARALGLF